MSDNANFDGSSKGSTSKTSEQMLPSDEDNDAFESNCDKDDFARAVVVFAHKPAFKSFGTRDSSWPSVVLPLPLVIGTYEAIALPFRCRVALRLRDEREKGEGKPPPCTLSGTHCGGGDERTGDTTPGRGDTVRTLLSVVPLDDDSDAVASAVTAGAITALHQVRKAFGVHMSRRQHYSG